MKQLEDFDYATISDLHLGHGRLMVDDINIQLDIFIRDMIINPPHMIVMNGDGTHGLLHLNHPHADIYMRLVYTLARLERDGKPVLLVLNDGTLSHEREQLNIFKFLETDSTLNVQIIRSTRVVEYMGRKILFIPDEYQAKPEEYFRPFIEVPTNFYDLLFCHGVMDIFGAVVLGDEKDKVIKDRYRYIFPSQIIKTIVRYMAYFGHIHNGYQSEWYTIIGSFFRYEHGQPFPKGYYRGSIKYGSSFKHNLIENIHAKEYSTIPIEEFLTTTIEGTISNINDYFNNHPIESLRIKVGHKAVENPLSHTVRDTYRNNTHIIIDMYKSKLKGAELKRQTKDLDNEDNANINTYIKSPDAAENITRHILYVENNFEVNDEVRNPPSEMVSRIKNNIYS